MLGIAANVDLRRSVPWIEGIKPVNALVFVSLVLVQQQLGTHFPFLPTGPITSAKLVANKTLDSLPQPGHVI